MDDHSTLYDMRERERESGLLGKNYLAKKNCKKLPFNYFLQIFVNVTFLTDRPISPLATSDIFILGITPRGNPYPNLQEPSFHNRVKRRTKGLSVRWRYSWRIAADEVYVDEQGAQTAKACEFD